MQYVVGLNRKVCVYMNKWFLGYDIFRIIIAVFLFAAGVYAVLMLRSA